MQWITYTLTERSNEFQDSRQGSREFVLRAELMIEIEHFEIAVVGTNR